MKVILETMQTPANEVGEHGVCPNCTLYGLADCTNVFTKLTDDSCEELVYHEGEPYFQYLLITGVEEE